jgi:hypothetical protein
MRCVKDFIASDPRVKKFLLAEPRHRDRVLRPAAREELTHLVGNGRVIDRRPREERERIPLRSFINPYVEERQSEADVVADKVRNLRGRNIVRIPVDSLRQYGDCIPFERSSREAIVREDCYLVTRLLQFWSELGDLLTVSGRSPRSVRSDRDSH